MLGKASIIDIFVVLVALALLTGYAYRQVSPQVQRIITADQVFHVTFVAPQVRIFSVEAVKEGDVFYKQYERQALGPVVGIKHEQAYEVATRLDGTAVHVPMEGKYDLYITIESRGSINENGYFANGTQQLSVGSRFTLVSNTLETLAYVYSIQE